MPFPTPLTSTWTRSSKGQDLHQRCLSNGDILEHVSTANVARDMDSIRICSARRKLNYFGYSYGTFLGATYASLFPKNYRAMVLDGPVDANRYINKPWQQLSEQSAGFERAWGRFMQACAADQVACNGFGGSDPWDAYDQLVDQSDMRARFRPRATPPIPLRSPATTSMPPSSSAACTPRRTGVPSAKPWRRPPPATPRSCASSSTRSSTGGIPGTARTTRGTIATSRSAPPSRSCSKDQEDFLLDRGDEAWAIYPHTYFNNGYVELNYVMWPKHDKDAYYGPFKIKDSSPTPLVVATTYDPATPYAGALRYVRDLHNVRLITMRGDGHTAYGGESACIDSAAEAYVNDLKLPPKGTVCRQEVQFEAPAVAQARAARSVVRAEARRVTGMRVPRP